jgi:hypothetical protein
VNFIEKQIVLKARGNFQIMNVNFTDLKSIKTNSLTNLLVAVSLALGVVAVMPTAPAHAVLLNGSLDFSDGTLDFASQVDPTDANDLFDVTFNPGSTAFINGVAGTDFSPLFTSFTTSPLLSSSTGTFKFLSGNSALFNYTLQNDLAFNFTNGVTFSLGTGSVFQGQNFSGNISFDLSSYVNSFFLLNGGNQTFVSALPGFNFRDNLNSGPGGYTISASTQKVPEPFTVIGTIIGGTAAFRMRKRLASAAKN